MTTQHTPKFPSNLQLDRGSIVGPMGEFYATLGECSVVFANALVERLNAHDELVAALRKIEAACDGDDAGAMFNPRAACKVSVKAARAALAKVQP